LPTLMCTNIYLSSHRKRQLARGGAAGLLAQTKSQQRLRAHYVALDRERSVRNIPFSQVVKAISWLNDQTSKQVWRAESKQRSVVSRQYAMWVLQAMGPLRPPPRNKPSPHVAFFVYDQTYAVAGGGGSHQHRNAVQTITADGKRKARQREVYINSFAVPADVDLSDEAIKTIEDRGPLTQDFRRVLPLLQPAASEMFTLDLFAESTRTHSGAFSKINLAIRRYGISWLPSLESLAILKRRHTWLISLRS